MSQRHQQICVLCGTAAEYCLADHQQRKHFFCSKCVEYQITVAAEEKLQSFPLDQRAQYAKEASEIGPDMVLSIFVPTVQRVDGMAYDTIRVERTRREDLSPCR